MPYLDLTFTLQPLVYEPVKEGATVITEGRASVGVYTEPVLGTVILNSTGCSTVQYSAVQDYKGEF